jgi:putative FmdB family regulatory protein
MPLYEYECDACGQRFELIRRFSDPPLDVCALCGKGPVNRLQSSPAIQFKGSGWYITDYARKGEGGKGDGGKEGKPEGGASEGTKAEVKTAEPGTKTETKSDTTAKPESPAATAPAKTSGAAKKD